jgi:hypothetical protein
VIVCTLLIAGTNNICLDYCRVFYLISLINVGFQYLDRSLLLFNLNLLSLGLLCHSRLVCDSGHLFLRGWSGYLSLWDHLWLIIVVFFEMYLLYIIFFNKLYDL